MIQTMADFLTAKIKVRKQSKKFFKVLKEK